MIIKRYTGEAFETLYPRTITTRLFNNAGTTRIFDSNDKIGLNFLPDSVFDSLYFYQTVGSGDGNLNSQAGIAIDDAYTKKRNPIGYY